MQRSSAIRHTARVGALKVENFGESELSVMPRNMVTRNFRRLELIQDKKYQENYEPPFLSVLSDFSQEKFSSKLLTTSIISSIM